MTQKKKLENKLKVIEKHGLKCFDCGKRDVSVKHTYCPFADEVYNEIFEMDLCPECEGIRADDI